MASDVDEVISGGTRDPGLRRRSRFPALGPIFRYISNCRELAL